MSSRTISGHGYRLQDRHCVPYPGEEGGTILSRGKGHLETVHAALGADGGNGPNSSIGPSLHAPSTEVLPQAAVASMVVFLCVYSLNMQQTVSGCPAGPGICKCCTFVVVYLVLGIPGHIPVSHRISGPVDRQKYDRGPVYGAYVQG